MCCKVILTTIAGACVALATHDIPERIRAAEVTLDELMKPSDKSIPRDLLEKAHCVAVIPEMKRGAFIVGAQYGVGFLTCRHPNGKGWTGPSTVKMEGGSVGLQIGGGETDVVLLVMNQLGAQKLMRSEFSLGAEGAAMAGPVGRSVSAETDAYLRAEILSYSRSRGVFAGVALKGTTLRSSDDDNEAMYGKGVTHKDILMGKVAAPASTSGLISRLNRLSSKETRGSGNQPSPRGAMGFVAKPSSNAAPQSDKSVKRLQREVRHELVMLPYYGVFDHLAYRVDGGKVTLYGAVTRPTLKSDAENVVKSIEGVETVDNQIEVLPLSSNDDRIRLAVYRSIFGQSALQRYGLQAVPPIHIIVKNGNVTLEGVVANEGDRNIANIQANSVSGVFSVKNNLRVEGSKDK